MIGFPNFKRIYLMGDCYSQKLWGETLLKIFFYSKIKEQINAKYLYL